MNLTSHSLWEKATLQSGGTAADTSVSSSRWQCEQIEAGMDVVFQYLLGSVNHIQEVPTFSIDYKKEPG